MAVSVWKRVLSLFLTVTIVTNANILTVIGLMALTSPIVSAAPFFEDDEIYKRLREKYSLDDPNRKNTNPNAREISPRASRDLTEYLERILTNPNNRGVDLSGFLENEHGVTYSDSRRLAAGLARTNNGPSLNPDGSLAVSYTRQGTRFFQRNEETGAYEMRIVEGAADFEMRTSGIEQDQYLSSEINHDQTAWEGSGTYGNEEALFEAGRQSHERLSDTSNRTSESVAYNTLRRSARQSVETYIPPTILQAGYDYVNEIADGGPAAADWFSSCQAITKENTIELYRPRPEEFRCQNNNLGGGICEIQRSVEIIGVVMQCSMSSKFCTNDDGSIAVNCTECIEVDVEAWDARIYGNVFANYLITDSEFNRLYSSSQMAANMNSGLWDEYRDYTMPNPFGTVYYELLGEGRLITDVTSIPEGCHEQVEKSWLDAGGFNGFLSQGISESEMPPSFCRFSEFNPTEVGTRGYPAGVLNTVEPLYPGDTGNITWKAELTNYQCDPLEGQPYCIVNAVGDEECYGWGNAPFGGGGSGDIRYDIPEDTCAPYREDSQCVIVSRECSEGWLDEESGTCYSETIIYECDRGNEVEYRYTSEESSCSGMIPCSGGDCDGSDERNDRFLETMVMAEVGQHMRADGACEDPQDPTTCRVFEGERQYCSWEVTGLGMDCCAAPDGIDIFTYLAATRQLMKYESAQLDGMFSKPAGDMVKGAWSTLSEPITNSNAWQSMSSSLSSFGENITGSADGLFSGADGSAFSIFEDEALKEFSLKVMQFVYDALPEQLGNLLFAAQEGVVEGFSEQIGQVGNMLSSLMSIYSTYQLIKLGLSLLTACDETDNDTAIKIPMRQCFKVDNRYCSIRSPFSRICIQRRQDYCCYSSMLGRIIMEQAAPMLGKDMGECSGLTHTELEGLDFSRIDFNEWIATMIEGDLLPEQSEDGQTGDGRMFNSDGRDNASTRSQERADGLGGTRENIRNILRNPSLNCGSTPRPPVCDFGFNPENN